MPTVQLTKKQLEELQRKGLIPVQPKGGKKKAVEVLPAEFKLTGDGMAVFQAGVKTASEVNSTAWRSRSARTKETRDAFTKLLGRNLRHMVAFAEAYHRGDEIHLHLTRCGGAKLDEMANLGTALKHTEDAIALVLGADDGSANWKAKAFQIPGGPIGVKVVMWIVPKSTNGGQGV